VLGTGSISAGQASISTVMLASGPRNLRARYSGSPGYSPGNSASIVEVVAPVPAGAPQQGSATGAGFASPIAIAAGDLNGDGRSILSSPVRAQ